MRSITEESKSFKERFMDRVSIEPVTDCWMWIGAVNNKGYGVFNPSSNSGNTLAHRWSYELYIGPITDGLQIDHVCNVRLCVNPEHLQLATARENQFAEHSNAQSKINKAKTHCPRGHELIGDNIRWHGPDKTWRDCMRCHLDGNLRRQKKNWPARQAYMKQWKQKRKQEFEKQKQESEKQF